MSSQAVVIGHSTAALRAELVLLLQPGRSCLKGCQRGGGRRLLPAATLLAGTRSTRIMRFEVPSLRVGRSNQHAVALAL